MLAKASDDYGPIPSMVMLKYHNKPTLNQMRESMLVQWTQTYGNSDKPQVVETDLVNADGGDNNDDDNGAAKPCKHCNRSGHKDEKCWSLPENAHLRPVWYAQKMEWERSCNPAVETNQLRAEVLL